jgi:hypothetical protein
MTWFTQEKPEEKTKNNEEFEINLAKKVTDSVTASLTTSIGETVKKYMDENPTLTELKATMEANRTRQQQQRTSEEQRQSQTEAERIAALRENMDDQTREYVDNQMSIINKTAMQTSARELRRSIFEDVDNYEYYTGDLKRRVDEILDREPLANQNNPDVVRNAYKVVAFEHFKDIQDGKLKSRLSTATSTSTPSNQNQPDPNALPTLSDDEKREARKMGITEKDWAQSKKEYLEEEAIRV